MSAIIRRMVMRKRAAACVAVVAQVKDDAGMKWRGQWQRSVEYVVGDVVSRKGSSYVATSASPGQPPGAGWAVLAEKGKDGTTTGPIGNATLPILIGTRPGGSEWLNGFVDEVRITAAALYTSAFTPPAAPFV